MKNIVDTLFLFYQEEEDKIIQEYVPGKQKGSCIVGIVSISNADNNSYISIIIDNMTTCGMIISKNSHNYSNKLLSEKIIRKTHTIIIIVGYMILAVDKEYIIVHNY